MKENQREGEGKIERGRTVSLGERWKRRSSSWKWKADPFALVDGGSNRQGLSLEGTVQTNTTMMSRFLLCIIFTLALCKSNQADNSTFTK